MMPNGLLSLVVALVVASSVVGSDIVCSSINGKARFMSSSNSCVCVGWAQESIPGHDCPTDPNGQAGCHGSCGLNCVKGAGGSCFIACNAGYSNANTSMCALTCNTPSVCTVDTTLPHFSKAFATCQPGGVGCDYGCSSGQKGCNGKRGCFRTCISGTRAAKKQRDRRVLLGKRNIRDQVLVAMQNGPSADGSWDPILCPDGLMACSIPGTSEKKWECIDSNNDVDSCGGCVGSTGKGVDCGALPGIMQVACMKGSCKIESCARGYTLDQNIGNSSSVCQKAVQEGLDFQTPST